MFVNNNQAANELFRNDGTGTFVAVTGTTLTASYGTHNKRHTAWGDYDGDGDLDAITLSVTNGGSGQRQHIELHENIGGASFTSATTSNSIATTSAVQTTSVVLGDIDGDGDLGTCMAHTSVSHVCTARRQHASWLTSRDEPIDLTLPCSTIACGHGRCDRWQHER